MDQRVMNDFPRVVLQAGGKGERMSREGVLLPKVLQRVGGVPLIEKLIRQLADEGARRFDVITGHLAEQVEAHLNDLTNLPPGVQIHFLRETSPRGNVGSLAFVPETTLPTLFLFGDLFTALPFRSLCDVHRQRGADITLCSHYEPHRLQLGHLIVEGDEVVGYREKPEYQYLICSGIAMLEGKVLDLLPRSGSVGLVNLVEHALQQSLKVTHWVHGAFWMDINTPALLEEANQRREMVAYA